MESSPAAHRASQDFSGDFFLKVFKVLNDFKDVKDLKDFYAMYSFLFPTYAYRKNFSLFVLSLRVLFGVLLMVHGIGKIMDFDTLSQTFPDPLGIGSRQSLMLAIFGEAVCSAASLPLMRLPQAAP